MTEQPRNWDKELADIDRVIGKQGTPPPGGVRPGPPARRHAGAHSASGYRRRAGRRARVGGDAWFWVGLAVLLAAALPLWPYGQTCGLQLFFYLGAAALAFLAGATGAVHSWRARRGLAHLIALLVVVLTGLMGAREVLPRIGYAAQAETWLCPSAPAPAPAATPAPAP